MPTCLRGTAGRVPRPSRACSRGRHERGAKPEEIGRTLMVEIVAEGVRAAMKNAGIEDPVDAHYVQNEDAAPHHRLGGGCQAAWRDRRLRGRRVDGVQRYDRPRYRGGPGRASDAAPSKSARTSTSIRWSRRVLRCGAESRPRSWSWDLRGRGGRDRIGHGVMKDALDSTGSTGPSERRTQPARPAPSQGPSGARGQLFPKVRGRPPRQAARPPREHVDDSTSIITATPKRRWARGGEAIGYPLCSSRSMQCTRGHPAAVQWIAIVEVGD